MMCDNCVEARKTAEQVASDMSRAEKSREFYRRQGECRERERIIKLLENAFISDGESLASAKLHELIALIKGENK